MTLQTTDDLREVERRGSLEIGTYAQVLNEHLAEVRWLEGEQRARPQASTDRALTFHRAQVRALQRLATEEDNLLLEVTARLQNEPGRATTLSESIAQLRSRRDLTSERRTALIAAVEARGDQVLTELETRELYRLRSELKILDGRLEELGASQDRDASTDKMRRDLNMTNRSATIGYEPRTYTPETSREGVSFILDALNRHQGGFEGLDRLERHHREAQVEREHRGQGPLEQRATTTGSFAGLVVPQYLVNAAALALRNGRPLASSYQQMPLPDQGTTFQVPKASTGASAAVQSTENSNVSSTDEVWANITVPVVTIAGQQDVSRQSLERGTPGLDQLIYTDLAGAYAAALDSQTINGSGAGGQMLGILNTAGITSASAFGAVVTAATFSTKLAGAVQAIQAAGTAISAKAVAMHPRRWGWLTGLSDSQGRPLAIAAPAGPYNAQGIITAPGSYSGDGPSTGEPGPKYVGILANGIPVITDANLPTNVGTNNEDVVLVLDTDQMLLWEDGDGMPTLLRFDQTLGNQLTVKIVVYGYAAFTAARYPGAVSKVGGLDTTATFGLVAPTF